MNGARLRVLQKRDAAIKAKIAAEEERLVPVTIECSASKKKFESVAGIRLSPVFLFAYERALKQVPTRRRLVAIQRIDIP